MTLTEWDSKAMLGPGLPRPREILSASVGEAVAFQGELAAPVVAKASGIAHKWEAGLVRLGLDADGVRDCWSTLAAAGDGSVVIAEQLVADLELIVGGVRDPQFGPLVTVGVGGIAAEVFADVAFLLAPPEDGELERAVAGLRAAPLFAGFRGSPPVDLVALARIVDAVAGLLAADETVTEVDCNPVVVVGGTPFVVDALVVLGER